MEAWEEVCSPTGDNFTRLLIESLRKATSWLRVSEIYHIIVSWWRLLSLYFTDVLHLILKSEKLKSYFVKTFCMYNDASVGCWFLSDVLHMVYTFNVKALFIEWILLLVSVEQNSHIVC